MPGDGLPLTVRVCGQIHRFDLLGYGCQFLDYLLLVLWDLIVRGEVLGHVYTEAVLGKVSDVAQGGHHLIILAQDFPYGPGLCGGFDYNQILCHISSYADVV